MLLASPSGQLAALTPLPEPAHRRLLSLSTQLLSALPAHAGLNAKAHRLPPQDAGANANVGVDMAAGRSAAVVDGEVLARWMELGAAKRAEIASKGGYDGVAELRAELEGVLGWTGMAYF